MCRHARIRYAWLSAHSLYAWCAQYPFAPPKLDDPEYNAEVMRSWRTKIQDARESFSKMDFEGAERALQLALEQAGHFGQSSGPVATSLLNLAQLYRRTGRLSEAEPLLERAADVLDQTAGPNNKVTLLALIDLANTKLENGDPTGSLGGFRDVLARLDIAEANQKHGAAALSSVRAGCLFSMAKGHAALDEVDEAEARLREVLSMVEARWGDTSVRVLAPCAELVRITALQGRLGESRALLARARALPELKPQQVTKLADLERELKL